MKQTCADLHRLFTRLPVHHFPFDREEIPGNGIYILFETGELAHGTNRIVRIGTHTGANQLPSRLRQHFVLKNKDRSIFRKNIGRAILNRDHDPFLAPWELDLTSSEAKRRYSGVIDRVKQQQMEAQVSRYIREHFFFVVFRVDEKDQRLAWESKMVSTVSWCMECRASEGWLGLSSPIKKICNGKLWLVNELYKEPLSEEECRTLEKVVVGG